MDKRRLAARILKVGKWRVHFDSNHRKEIEEAITASDFRILIKKGYIKKLPEKKNLSVNKDKRKGKGRRKGGKYSRLNSKRRWIIKIRALRRELKKLKEEGKIDKATYKDLYRKAGGGFFRDKA
ncbi:MAG: 50S ribosomal protein L19e, partial [Candidatus Aenigmarchaeota archaeon ex4484_56]